MEKFTPYMLVVGLVFFGFVSVGHAQSQDIGGPLVCTGPQQVAVGQQVAFSASGGTAPYGWVVRGSTNCSTFCGPHEFGFNPLVTSFQRSGTYTATTTDNSGGGTGIGFQTANCTIEVLSSSSSAPPSSGSSSNTSSNTGELFFGIAQNYVDSLLNIFGTKPQTQTSAPTPPPTQPPQNCPPKTESEIRQFQCQEGIVCSGTKETTGYGNLGPRTRARIAEVYPAAVRQSCEEVPPSSPGPSPTPPPTSPPTSDGTTIRVVSDIFTMNMSPSIARSFDKNGSGKDKCQQIFSGRNVREIGYDGGERVLWCAGYSNFTYVPGTEEAVVLTDAQLLYPAQACSTLGSGWEEIPGNEGKVITYCQRLQQVSFESLENRDTRAVAYVFAVPMEKSSNPLKRIKDKIDGLLRDLLGLHDAFEDIVPEHSLLNRHLDTITFMLKPIDHIVGDDDVDDALEKTYHHGKADKLFLEVKPLYPFDTPGGNSSDNGGSTGPSGDQPPNPGPIVRGASTNFSSNALSAISATLSGIKEILLLIQID